MHGSIRLEVGFNVAFVLLNHELGFDFIGVWSEDFVKISTHLVLLIVEAIKVDSTDGKDMLSKKLSNHTSSISKTMIKQSVCCFTYL